MGLWASGEEAYCKRAQKVVVCGVRIYRKEYN